MYSSQLVDMKEHKSNLHKHINSITTFLELRLFVQQQYLYISEGCTCHTIYGGQRYATSKFLYEEALQYAS